MSMFFNGKHIKQTEYTVFSVIILELTGIDKWLLIKFTFNTIEKKKTICLNINFKILNPFLFACIYCKLALCV